MNANGGWAVVLREYREVGVTMHLYVIGSLIGNGGIYGEDEGKSSLCRKEVAMLRTYTRKKLSKSRKCLHISWSTIATLAMGIPLCKHVQVNSFILLTSFGCTPSVKSYMPG